MILKFCYNVDKKSIYLKALKHHAKNNPKSYVFKPAKSLDNKNILDMEAVFCYRSQKHLERHQSLKEYLSIKDSIINTYLMDSIPQKNIEITNVNISKIRSGDTIFFNGVLRTVSSSDIKSGFCGVTLFGDSYNLGRLPVKKVLFLVPTNKGIVKR